MKSNHNVRYEIFQNYAKKNNLKGTILEYMDFVNKYNNRENNKIKNMYESFYSYLKTNTEKFLPHAFLFFFSFLLLLTLLSAIIFSIEYFAIGFLVALS